MTQPPPPPYGPPDEGPQYPGSQPTPPGPQYGQPSQHLPPTPPPSQQYPGQPTPSSSSRSPHPGPPDDPSATRQSWSALRSPDFFRTLFSLDFNRFITGRVLGVVYGLIMVLLAITYLVVVVAAFTQNAGVGILTLLVGALAFLVYLIFARITLEFYAATIKTAENTGRLLERDQNRD